jgi:hypothetical protein
MVRCFAKTPHGRLKLRRCFSLGLIEQTLRVADTYQTRKLLRLDKWCKAVVASVGVRKRRADHTVTEVMTGVVALRAFSEGTIINKAVVRLHAREIYTGIVIKRVLRILVDPI